MFRSIISVILGLSAALLVIKGFEILNNQSYPLPGHIDPADQHSVAQFVQTLPSKALWMTIAGWACGSFILGLFIGLVARWEAKMTVYLGGLLMMTGGIVSILMYDRPLWFIITGLLCFIPMTFAGFYTVRIFRK